MWDYSENLIYDSLFLLSVLNKCITIFLHKVIQRNSKGSCSQYYPAMLKKYNSQYTFFLADNPDSIPLLPVIIILSYNDILRMIYALKILLITK